MPEVRISPERSVIYLAIMPADIPGLCYAATYDEAGNMVENLNELTMAQVSYIAAQRNLRVVTTG